MQIRNKRDQYMVAFIIIGVLVLVWNFLFPPPKSGAKATLLPLAEAQHKTEVQKRTYLRLANDAKTLGPRIAREAYDAPVEELVPLVIRDLQSAAERAHVHLREIKPLRARSVGGLNLSRVPIEARFRAPFQPGVVRFLYELEDPAGKIVVDRLNITSGEARLKTVDVTVQISVFTRAITSETGSGEGEASDAASKNTTSP